MLEHQTDKILKKGNAHKLGATLHKNSVNFAVYSKNAQQVYLLLFDNAHGAVPTDIIKIENKINDIWHVSVEGIGANQLYAYKVDGPYDPDNGHRFNINKLLLDPYAKALSHKVYEANSLLLGFNRKSNLKDLAMDERDSSLIVPKSVVVDEAFDWKGVESPNYEMKDLIIYEVNLKGFTADKSSKVSKAGTYLGFIEKIPHLKELGITAVELLPIHEFFVSERLKKLDLNNYWGYDTVSYFSPEISYSSQESYDAPIREFKTLVRELHKAGIEVILDVVYNHTAEGNEMGPTISFKGLENSAYYRLMPDPSAKDKENKRFYINDSGCGNTVRAEHAVTARMILDSLRYWADVCHVDGFRFDLASILGKKDGPFTKEALFFEAISKDPILSKKKMIAEPWDLAAYEIGNFPQDWAEWNGKFRDTMRKFLKGDDHLIGDFAARISGSADMFKHSGRGSDASINFITCHDGFTLNDLYSYNHKHNKANGEKNRDGADHNESWNCGVEGPSKNKDVIKLRRKMYKNAMFMLFLSNGVPMMLSGDEVLKSTNGNNNTYCQDTKLSWFDWKLLEKNKDILDFCKKAIAFRKEYPVMGADSDYLEGDELDTDGVANMHWYDKHLHEPAWNHPKSKTLAHLLAGEKDKNGRSEYYLYFLYNMHYRGCSVYLPELEGVKWHRVIDTSREYGDDFIFTSRKVGKKVSGKSHHCSPRSCVLFLGKR